MIVAETGAHSIVKDHAVLFQHNPITALTGGQFKERIGVHAGDKFRRIRALNVDFTERTGIQNADAIAHRQTLAINRLAQAFNAACGARTRIVPRAFPLTDIFKLGAARKVPAVHRGMALRVEKRADITTGNRAKGSRCIGRAKNGRAGLGHALTERLGEYRHAIDIAKLALIGTKTERGVALDMLNRFEPLAHRDLDTAGGDIQLHIDKLTGGAGAALGVRHQK